MADLLGYLRYVKHLATNNFEDIKRVHVVLGNESCDLDSVVSSIVYSLYLHQTRHGEEPDTVHIAVLNIPASKHRLRTANTHVLSLLNITDDALVFRDDVDLARLFDESRLSLTLVDHNVLNRVDGQLEEAVVRVIDHHVDERITNERTQVEIDSVGSCCTLIAEQLIRNNTFTVNTSLALILYATILVDTINLSPESGKTTRRDVDVVRTLKTLLTDMDTTQLYRDIQEAKFDLTGLSNMDLLEMDLKMVEGGDINIAVSSVTMHIEDLVSRVGFVEDLQLFCQTKGISAVVIMTLSSPQSVVPQRQIAVFSPDSSLRKQITEIIETTKNPSFELSPLEFFSETMNIYDQGNMQASRKKVLPILKSYVRDRTNIQQTKHSLPQHGISLSFDESNNNDEDSAFYMSNIASIGDVNFVDISRGSSDVTDGQQEEFSSCVSDNLMFYDNGLLGACSSHTPEGGLSNPHTPPNSRNSQDGVQSDDEHDLPSFNSAEMVNRIIKKKASLEQLVSFDPCANYPFTPPNSFVNSDLSGRETHLPSFLNSEMVHKIQDKKEEMGAASVDCSEDGKYPFTPHNSFVDVKFKDSYLHREDRGNMVDLLPLDMEDRVFKKQSLLEESDDIHDYDSDIDFLSHNNDRLVPHRSKSPFMSSIQTQNFSEILEHGPEFCKSLRGYDAGIGKDFGKASLSGLSSGNPPCPFNDGNFPNETVCNDVSVNNRDGESGSNAFSPNHESSNLNSLADDHDESHDGVVTQYDSSSDEVRADGVSQAIVADVKTLPNGQSGSEEGISADSVSRAINGNHSVKLPPDNDRNNAINVVAGYIATEIISSAISRVFDDRKNDALPDDVQNVIAKTIAEDIINEDRATVPTIGVLPPGDSVESDSYMSTSDDELSDNESNIVAGLIAAEIRSNRFSTGDITLTTDSKILFSENFKIPQCLKDDIPESVDDAEKPPAGRDDINKVAYDIAHQIVSDAKQKYIGLYGDAGERVNLDEHFNARLKYLQECSDIDRLSYLLTADIITNALDSFPVYDIHKKDILSDSNDLSKENVDEGDDSAMMVETDYLPRVDPYKGDISYAITYPNSLKSYIRNMSISDPNQDMSTLMDAEDVCSPALTEDDEALLSLDDITSNIECENLRKSVFENDATVISPGPQKVVVELPSPQTNYAKKLANSQSVDASNFTEAQNRHIYMTSAGRMSISLDSVVSISNTTTPTRDTRLDRDRHQEENHHEWWDGNESELKLSDESVQRGHKRGISSSSIEAVEKMRDVMFTKEYPEEDPSLEEDEMDSVLGPLRPETFDTSSQRRKHKLIPMISVTVDDDLNGVTPSTPSDTELPDIDILETPEGIDTPPDVDSPGDLDTPQDGKVVDEDEWERMALLSSKLEEVSSERQGKAIPEYTALEECRETRHWRNVMIGEQHHTIDMEVIEPYKRVLHHGGYIMDGMNAVILFCGCFLPERGHPDYQYIMNNLFLYIINTLDTLIVQDYTIVYFHGATPRRQTPSFSWLRRCYQMIDRRLKKTLCGLLLVHPTLWLKTVVLMSRPFISSKFGSQIKFVKTLTELELIIPMDNVFIPEPIKLYDERLFRTVGAPSPPMSPPDSPLATQGQGHDSTSFS